MDIKAQYEHLLPEIKQLVGDVIDSGRFILGPNVRALEAANRYVRDSAARFPDRLIPAGWVDPKATRSGAGAA